MVDIELLKDKIKKSGLTVKDIAKMSGMLRETLYNRFKNHNDFKASEIMRLTKILKLTKKERDDIFLQMTLNIIQQKNQSRPHRKKGKWNGSRQQSTCLLG